MSVSETESGRKFYSDEFETFWSHYPKQRRSKKGDAYRKWKAAIKNAAPEHLIARCKDYASSNLGRGEFACMPSVWLSGEMWLDAPEAWEAASGVKQPGKPASRVPTPEMLKAWKPEGYDNETNSFR